MDERTSRYLRSGGVSLNICVVGTGYVGLTTGVCLAYLGHRVNCLDVDQNKIDLLQNGRVPIHEPNLEVALGAGSDYIRFYSVPALSIAGADVVYFA